MDRITVICIGKLGLCIALSFERAGFSVMGVDINQDYINAINQKTLNSYEPKVNEYLRESKNFIATTNLKHGLEFSDNIFIVALTPNGGGDNFYDHSILSKILFDINACNVKNKTIVICCTVMPKYIDTVTT